MPVSIDEVNAEIEPPQPASSPSESRPQGAETTPEERERKLREWYERQMCRTDRVRAD